ncbi:MAG: insulinase family protein [Acidobacteriia bacterium]|nr:insulinase family protein [Terriglobia bacterium]
MRNPVTTLLCTTFLALTSSLFAAGQSPAKQWPPAGGPPKAFHLPQVERFSLPNGLQVTLVPYGSIPKVRINVAVRAGNLNESASETWLADLTGELMKEGTTSRSSQQVAQEAASMGGSVEIGAGPDVTNISADVLSEFGPKMVALLADVAEHPLLPGSELARLKQDLLRQLSVQKSQSGALARERFLKALYPDHPYGRLLSTEPIISSFDVQAVKKFYDENFGAARTHIYVAGKFHSAAVKAAVTQAFSGWKRGPDPLIEIPKPVSNREVDLVDRPGAAQSTLYIGLSTIDPSNADYIPLQVMDSLLGGSFGSRITANIREQKGYTYSPRSQISARYRDAYWAEVADVTTAVTGPSIKEILYEIDRLQKSPPSDAELDGIKNYLAGVFVLRNSSRDGLIAQLQYVDLHQLGDNYLDTYVQKVYALTPQQVQEMAQKYILADKLTIVVVGDKEKVAGQIAPYEKSGS